MASSSSQIYDNELPNQPWSAKCPCGKRFRQPNSYALHVRCCSGFKKRLGRNLEEARQRHQGAVLHHSEMQLSENAEGEGGPRSKKRRIRPAWLAESSEDVDVDFVKSSSLNTAVHPNSLPGAESEAHSDPTLPQGSVTLANEENIVEEELGRGHRKKYLSYKIKRAANVKPSSVATLPPSLFHEVLANSEPEPPTQQSSTRAPTIHCPCTEKSTTLEPEVVKTQPNTFGLYKSYKVYADDVPHDPDSVCSPSDFHEKPRGHTEVSDVESAKPAPSLYPFPNLSSFRLGEWFWSDDHEKSQRSFQNLLNIVGSNEFNPADVSKTNWRQVNEILATSQYEDGGAGNFGLDDGVSWRTTSVTIRVPISKSSEQPGSYQFTVPGFHYRPLIPVIKEKLTSATQQEHFHTLGCELRWRPGEHKEDVRVYGEMYNSPVFIEAYEDLQGTPPEPGCSLSRHIVGLMFASDATMLASFGSAKLWPLYMFFANDSKYKRAQPSERLFETIAYFEKLPDKFKDFVGRFTGKSSLNPTLLTHCQRELFHEQWKIILDPEFLEAYCHGIVVTCYDGVQRRFYPRIFTYSADYPEKILIASIKNLGSFPCPRCKVAMTDVPAMGKARDRSNRMRLIRKDDENRKKRVADARTYLYEDHLSFASNLVEARMDEGSLVPTDNAFSSRLSSHGFDLFRMLVVDLMHEVELGSWKAVFIHLLRLLEATKKGTMNELDARYRSMPTFGRDTIRRFINNVSEMKQLAARDFEDLLQCAIPAFEGLLPSPHNERVMKLLFTFGRWHGFAKLRLHTDHTLNVLDSLTTQLGDDVRAFVEKTCSKIQTKELAREYQARKRRQTRKSQAAAPAAEAAPQAAGAPQPSVDQPQEPSNGLVNEASRHSNDDTSAMNASQAPQNQQYAPGELQATPGKEPTGEGVVDDTNMNVQGGMTSAIAGPSRLGEANQDASANESQSATGMGRKRKRGPLAQPVRVSTRIKAIQAIQASSSGTGQSRLETTSKPKQSEKATGRRKKGLPAATKTSTTQSRDEPLEIQGSDNFIESYPDDPKGNEHSKKRQSSTTTETPAAKRQKTGQKAPTRAAETLETNQGGELESSEPQTSSNDDASDGRKAKTLNLNTYKWHSLGDVVPTIRLFGTTDSYSTQIPERFHRYPKMHYKRTSKKNVSHQLSRIQARQARIRKLRKQLIPETAEGYNDSGGEEAPYFIGKSENHPVDLPALVQTKKNDPAVKDFIPKLKSHILPRIYHRLLEEEEASENKDELRLQLLKSLVSESSSSVHESTSTLHGTTTLSAPSDVDRIYIHSDRIFQHNILNINYTTYDVRRETDIVNPKTSRRDIMCLRAVDETELESSKASLVHRYMHARVLGVYHVNVVYRGRGAKDLRKHRFDFLWVRWYSFCEDVPATDSFDRLSLRPVTSPSSIGFLDPMDVVRASYIIPRYSLGLVHGPNVTGRFESKLAKDQDDWHEYYINCFVDRDMLMRYLWGYGVGHTYSHGDAPDVLPQSSINSTTNIHVQTLQDTTRPRDASISPSSKGASDDASDGQIQLEESVAAAEKQESLDEEQTHDDTLDNLEEEELAVAEPDEEDEEDNLEGCDVQEPEPDDEDFH